MRQSAIIGAALACAVSLACTRGQPEPHGDASPPPLAAEEDSSALAPARTEGDASTPPALPMPGAAVRWFGALYAIMHEGRTESAVTLTDVLPGPHAWGVGALEGLAGEITILDDVVWLARPNADATASLSHAAIGELDPAPGAALLVIANVEAWDELPVATDVAWSGLDGFLEAQLVARGERLEQPAALRIAGGVRSLRWHVIDGSKMQTGGHHADHARSAVSGTIDNAEVELIGFFSRAHQGVFTHAGSHSHFHVVSADGKVSGHVDGMDLVAGARLLLPHR